MDWDPRNLTARNLLIILFAFTLVWILAIPPGAADRFVLIVIAFAIAWWFYMNSSGSQESKKKDKKRDEDEDEDECGDTFPVQCTE